MKESAPIAGLSADLYDGKPWIDVNILDSIKCLSAEQAVATQGEGWNSIWQIINHLTSWRDHLLQNLRGGKNTSPNDNYFRPVVDTTSEAWQSTLEKLTLSQQQWQIFLLQMDEQFLMDTLPGHTFNNYRYIYGFIQNDAYHPGQVAMLAKHNQHVVKQL